MVSLHTKPQVLHAGAVVDFTIVVTNGGIGTDQCDKIRAKFRHLERFLKVFGNITEV